MPNDQYRRTIRFPLPLDTQIGIMAAKNRKSVNELVVEACEKYVKALEEEESIQK